MTRFSRSAILSTILAAVGVGQSSPLRAEGPPAVVSHVKVLSDKVRRRLQPRGLEAVVHQAGHDRRAEGPGHLGDGRASSSTRTPRRASSSRTRTSSSIRSRCSTSTATRSAAWPSSNVQALARYVGLEARGWTIKAHVVPEVLLGRPVAPARRLADQLLPQARRQDRQRRGDHAGGGRLVQGQPRVQRQRRQAAQVPRRGRLDGLEARARTAWPAARSTTATAGCPPTRTAGTARCRSTTARRSSPTSTAIRRATRSTSSCGPASGSCATGRTRDCT